MSLVDTDHLAGTIDRIAAAEFYKRPLSSPERARAAQWLADRQGAPGAYANTFALAAADAPTVRMFSGDGFTHASGRHVIGEEGCRALKFLRPRTKASRAALAAALDGIESCLTRGAPDAGHYCCFPCSVGLWRNLTTGQLSNAEARLANGLRDLRGRRLGNGRWQTFPFHYTILALIDIDLPEASEELRYAAPVLERMANRKPVGGYGERRRHIAERALGRC